MNYTLIEKAAKLYEKIKVLDNEIIAIDKMAQLFANEDAEAELKLKYVESKKEEKQNIVDEDGSLSSIERMMRQMYRPMSLTWGIDYAKGCKPEDKQSYEAKISNTAALQMLGILLGDKHQKRAQLIKEIEAIMTKQLS
jgi:hypothetical protein